MPKQSLAVKDGHYCALMTTTADYRARQNFRGVHRRLAGDTRHGGVNQRHLRVHNSSTVTPAPLTLTGVVCSGGATARSGGDATVNDDSNVQLRSAQTSGCPSFYKL